ncbi:unnamed protein product [Gadus morhua 'NCC']
MCAARCLKGNIGCGGRAPLSRWSPLQLHSAGSRRTLLVGAMKQEPGLKMGRLDGFIVSDEDVFWVGSSKPMGWGTQLSPRCLRWRPQELLKEETRSATRSAWMRHARFSH